MGFIELPLVDGWRALKRRDKYPGRTGNYLRPLLRPCEVSAVDSLHPGNISLENVKLRVQIGAFMKHQDLQNRTKQFALEIIRFCESLPKDETSRILGRQLLRSGTSVGANYRAACRAKSKPAFISKIGDVLEEADESGYWLELLAASGKIDNKTAAPLLNEANELTAIFISSINTAKRNTGVK
jgi:four helix bundle protein